MTAMAVAPPIVPSGSRSSVSGISLTSTSQIGTSLPCKRLIRDSIMHRSAGQSCAVHSTISSAVSSAVAARSFSRTKASDVSASKSA